jgi:hypothetical protein
MLPADGVSPALDELAPTCDYGPRKSLLAGLPENPDPANAKTLTNGEASSLHFTLNGRLSMPAGVMKPMVLCNQTVL